MPSCPDAELLAAIYALQSVPKLGPAKLRDLKAANLDPIAVATHGCEVSLAGKVWDNLRLGIRALADTQLTAHQKRADEDIALAKKNGWGIYIPTDDHCPPAIRATETHAAVIYARGDLEALEKPLRLAFVGSRKTTEPYLSAQRQLAKYAATSGWTIVSGFAHGADAASHQGALDASGHTIGVLACGIDKPERQNGELWSLIAEQPNVLLVSQWAFGSDVKKPQLRQRNLVLIDLCAGVFAGQAADKSGTKISIDEAARQKKPVATFLPDRDDSSTSQNKRIACELAGTTLQMKQDAGWLQWLDTLRQPPSLPLHPQHEP